MGKENNNLKSQLVKYLDSANQTEIKKVILQIGPKDLVGIKDFCGRFITTYTDPEFQQKTLTNIIEKLDALHTKDDASLKMEAMFYKGKAIIELNKNNEKEQVKYEKYTEALNLFEGANELMITNGVKTKISPLQEIDDLITEYEPLNEAYELAVESIKYREKIEYSGVYKKYAVLVNAYLRAADIANYIDDEDIKIEVLKYASKAYKHKLFTDSTNFEKNGYKSEYDKNSAAKFIASIYRSFGAKKKAEILELINQNKSADTSEDKFKFDPIKEFNVETREIIELRKSMQSTLDKISEAAARGKWYDMQFTGQAGVSAYVTEDMAKHGENTEKLCLIFEAICIGVMFSESKDPTAAVIFAQKFPSIVTAVINNHPEYIIDSHMLQSCLLNANEFKGIVVNYIEKNNDYNKYLESVLLPVIVEKIEKTVLSPIEKLIETGAWSKSAETTLLSYMSDNSLLGNSLVSGYLGQNIGSIDDAANIARLLILDKMMLTMHNNVITNYEPIKLFAKTYPHLTQRALEDKPDVFTNEHMRDIAIEVSNVAIKTMEIAAQKKASEEAVNKEESAAEEIAESTIATSKKADDDIFNKMSQIADKAKNVAEEPLEDDMDLSGADASNADAIEG